MSLINSTRSGCRDVFRAFLVKDATYDGDLEIPRIMPESSIPNKLILFSKALKAMIMIAGSAFMRMTPHLSDCGTTRTGISLY